MAEWIPGTFLEDEPTMAPIPPTSHAIVGLDVQIEDNEIPQSTLSDSQEKVLSSLFVVSAFLSIVGSATIVRKVLRNRSIASPYDRLLLGLSVCDIIASSTYAMWPFLLPNESSKRIWAIGNDATCNLLGFLTQLSFAAMMYNGVLSYYYLLTIRFGWKQQRLARIEKWMHFFAICYPLVTASLGAAFGVFHELEVGFGCWTNNYPHGCEGDECTAHIWGYTFGLVPIGFTFGSLVINNIIIYRYVRRMLHTAPPSPPGARVSEVPKDDGESPDATKAKHLDESRQSHIKEVAIQGFLYVGTFFFSYWSPIVLRVLEHLILTLDDSSLYPLLVLQSICLPLQGFFNMFVYNRQNFLRLRAANPTMTAMEALWKSCFDASIPRRLTDVTSLCPASTTDGNATSGKVDGEPTLHSAATSLSNGSPYFREHPLDYFNACAQMLASSSSAQSLPVARSVTSSNNTPHTTLPVVEEEGDEEGTNKDGTNRVQRVSSTQRSEERRPSERNVQEPLPIDLESEDTKEPDAVIIPSLDSTTLVASNLIHLGGQIIPVTRSFRIRMDGAVELEEKQEDTC